MVSAWAVRLHHRAAWHDSKFKTLSGGDHMKLNNSIPIRIRHLSKVFKIYSKPSDMFIEVLTGNPRHHAFCALKDISFDVSKGEVVGIIGRNGSGKSTLLRIIAGTLDKTEGEVTVNGTISAILELGSGFHPEYTGRQNIYMGGMCLGMSRHEIDKKLDWIIDFSELGDFIERPFKTYSSGMQTRLTFSLVASVDPDILVIDEALSAGDAKFQRKCFGIFDRFRKRGKTILFVSHDVNAINQLCDRAILLSGGRIVEEGIPKFVTKTYHKMLFGEKTEHISETFSDEEDSEPKRGQNEFRDQLRLKELILQKISDFSDDTNVEEVRYGSKKAEIIDFGILDELNSKSEVIETGGRYRIFFTVLFYEELENLTFGCRIHNIKGMDVFAANTQYHKVVVPPQKKGGVLNIFFDVEMWLAPGDFFMTFGVRRIDESIFCDRRVDAFHFKVVGDSKIDSVCLVNLNEKISVEGVTV